MTNNYEEKKYMTKDVGALIITSKNKIKNIEGFNIYISPSRKRSTISQETLIRDMNFTHENLDLKTLEHYKDQLKKEIPDINTDAMELIVNPISKEFYNKYKFVVEMDYIILFPHNNSIIDFNLDKEIEICHLKYPNAKIIVTSNPIPSGSTTKDTFIKGRCKRAYSIANYILNNDMKKGEIRYSIDFNRNPICPEEYDNCILNFCDIYATYGCNLGDNKLSEREHRSLKGKNTNKNRDRIMGTELARFFNIDEYGLHIGLAFMNVQTVQFNNKSQGYNYYGGSNMETGRKLNIEIVDAEEFNKGRNTIKLEIPMEYRESLSTPILNGKVVKIKDIDLTILIGSKSKTYLGAKNLVGIIKRDCGINTEIKHHNFASFIRLRK